MTAGSVGTLVPPICKIGEPARLTPASHRRPERLDGHRHTGHRGRRTGLPQRGKARWAANWRKRALPRQKRDKSRLFSAPLSAQGSLKKFTIWPHRINLVVSFHLSLAPDLRHVSGDTTLSVPAQDRKLHRQARSADDLNGVRSDAAAGFQGRIMHKFHLSCSEAAQ